MSEKTDDAVDATKAEPAAGVPAADDVKLTDGLDLSWMTDEESEYLEDLERSMGTAVEIVGVARETIDLGKRFRHLCPVTVEVQFKGLDRRYRIVREDEIWSHVKAGHRACYGRGYLVYAEKSLGSVAVEVEDVADAKVKTVEHRRRCPCAVMEFVRKSPTVVPQPKQWRSIHMPPDFFYWEVKTAADGLERPEVETEIENELRQEEAQLSEREQYKQRAQKFRSEAEELEGKAKALDAEIAESMVPYEAEVSRLKEIVSNELLPKKAALTKESSKLAHLAKEAEAVAEDLRVEAERAKEEAEKSEAEAKSKRRVADLAVASTVDEVRAIDARASGIERQIDRLPIPSRATRLRREKRVLLEKAERLRKKADQKESFAGPTPEAQAS
jgi:hypothetical protein